MNLIITKGLGPSTGLAGRDGLITQGFGGTPNTVEVPAHTTDWKWIEFARLRNIQGIDPIGISSVRTVELSLPSMEEGSQTIGIRTVPVVRARAGSPAAHKLRALKRRR